LANVLKFNVYYTSIEKFAAVNAFLTRAVSRSTRRRAFLPVCRPGPIPLTSRSTASPRFSANGDPCRLAQEIRSPDTGHA
jgi:hypothetical protein